MSDIHINKIFNNFVIFLLLLFPLVIITVKIIGNLILLILTISGIYILFKIKENPFKTPELKLLSWVAVGYFLVMFISIVQNNEFVGDIHHLGRKVHFLLAPFIALAVYKVDLSIDKLLFSFKIGLVIATSIVFWQSSNGSIRPSGMYNANIFGDIVLVLFFLSIVNFVEEKPLVKLLSILSSVMAIYAIILSGNRATFLLLIFVGVVYLLLINTKYLHRNTTKRTASIVIFIAIIAAVSLHPKIISGVEQAVNNIIYWKSYGSTVSSTGIRLDMWFASIEAFKESPWLGHGYRNANEVVSKYVNPDIAYRIQEYTHLHNEYITNLVSAGLLGLISVIALLFLPFKVFFQNLQRDEVWVYAAMGVLLCTSYAGIGMTHIAFGEEHINAVYVYFIAILLPKVARKQS